ncbi:hypothetical protein NYZ99_19470 [Maribacter litopenaei]|uniref:NIPSNAP protein n=1 Tax=Maribacter litopenaei TaxID=2976127 RepID=A0ABY5Y7N0_9FLAO|nr:hypothetical protein [Maribacter litopenaei]UWX54888.1 hypothetical protein NYZ99_19470 [Maribacter litopenaei]
MKTHQKIIKSCLFILITMLVLTVEAQDKNTSYVVCTYMKAKPGMEQDYKALAQVWKKIYKNLERDSIAWALYEVPTNAGVQGKYHYVGAIFFGSQKGMADYYGDKQLFNNTKGLSPNEINLMQRSDEIREVIREDVMIWRGVVRNKVSYPKYLWVEQHKLNPNERGKDYLDMTGKVTVPVIRKMVDAEDLEAMYVFQRRLPSGTSADFNLFRILGFTSFEKLLAYPEISNKVFSEINSNLIGYDWKPDITELVAEELWKLVDTTFEQ